MMKDNLFNQFILSFSYTTKLRFAVFFGLLPSFFIILFAIFLFVKPQASLDLQLEGVQFYKELIATIDSTLKYYQVFVQGGKDRQLQTAIDLHFSHLKTMLSSFEKRQTFSFEDAAEISTYLNLMNHLWEDLKKLQKNDLEEADRDINSIYLANVYLLESLARGSKLFVNLDYGTRYYIYGFIRSLPMIENNLVHLNIYSRNKDPHSQEAKAKILAHLDKLQKISKFFLESLDVSYNQNPIFTQQPYAGNVTSQMRLFENLLQEYKQKIEHWIHSDFNPNAKDISAIPLIAAAFQLTKEMMEQLTFVLKEQQETLLRNFFGSFICVCFIVFIVASVNFGRLTRRPLQNLQNAAKEFAKGNFSVRVPIVENNEVGEISEAFNHLMRHFEKILADATAITRGLLTSSSDILSSSRQLELNVVQQEKSIKEIALKSQETMHIVQKFAEDFKNVGRDISKTRLVAATGSANLAAMEKIMRQMIEASANIVKAFSLLQKKAEAMTQVIETIIRIADQSNLLALNTAIRASKAGEHGKGFVVIADKIRELADKISYAALDIETTIKVILEAVSKAVEEVGVFSGNIHNQFQDTLNINQEFNNLIYGTQGRIHYFEDISEGMKKQNLEIIEMNRGLEQLKNVSSQTAGAIKKLYVEIEYLFDSAQSLQEMTKDFIFTEFLHS